MDFIDQIKQFAKRIEQIKDQIATEEATKTSMIMPFFQLLGYDIFNPSEFVPEFTADVGIKKGEKVDYAIMIDDKPVILIEAKWCGEKLEKHDSQLFRYFGTTSAKFAILTNGLNYRFYTDLDEQNKMDEKPFLEFNLLDLKDTLIPELKKFQKHNFDIETIFNTASELKYTYQIKQLMLQQITSPTDSFINYVLGEVYPGRKTQNVVDKFRDVVKKSLNQFINEIMSDRIKAAIENQSKNENVDNEKETTDEELPESISKIITTEEELEGFFIVKFILKELNLSDRISHKDTESYFGILLDDNTRKWICRLQLNTSQKYIIIPDENKKVVRYPISSVEDIYNYKKQLIQVIDKYSKD